MDNCQLPKGYKNTEVGVIPEDWDVKPLFEIGDIATGTTPPTNNKSNYGEDYFFVSPADLGKGKYIVDTEKKLSKLGFSIARKYPANSILFTCIGSTIGKAGIAKIELTSNQQINAVFPNESYSSDFLFYYLNFISPKIKMGASEQAVPMINKTEFGKTSIALPTKAEQTAIATALSDTDALINSLEKLIAKKRNIKQGAMQQLLKPKEGWEVKKLGDLITYKNGKSFESFIDENGEYYLITLNSIDIKGELKKEHLRVKEFDNSLEKGDLVMVLSDVAHGNFLGLTDVIPENNKYVLNQRMGALKNLRGVTSRFLSIYINHFQSYFKLSGKGSSQQNLGKDDILKFEIHLPSLDEQNEISTILSDMDAEIQALETKLEKYRKIKLGMMQNLLTGKIRLV